MLLEDATSKEEVEAALAEGDDELEDDISSILRDLTRRVEQSVEQSEPMEIEAIVRDGSDFFEAVVEQSDPDLSAVPPEFIKNGLAVEARRGRPGQAGIFEWAGDYYRRSCRGGFSYSFDPGAEVHLSDYYLDQIENYEFIPQNLVEKFYEGFRDIEWQGHTDRLEDQFGNGPWGEDVEICASEDDFREFCHDILKEYRRSLVEKDPAAVLPMFIERMSEISATLGKNLRERPPSQEELIELASQWVEADEDEEKEVAEKLNDYYDTLDSPVPEDRRSIATFERKELEEMNVKKGTLLEQAPWKLIKLVPSELRMEGTRMKHCVGDKGMGYIQAVKDGDVEIWSLRDRDNKPRFTLEVDSSFYEAEDLAKSEMGGKEPTHFTAPYYRARAIKQLKGAANRTPGYASRGDSAIKFPEEVIFWKQVLTDIGVDPKAVGDFSAARLEDVKKNARDFQGNTSFDEPYRPLHQNRSFDEPYRPLGRNKRRLA